ncbi:hypothetical protein A33M_2352 [Rhodovulum sp. PH10]|nr:hypothetical protein A33M_2352 [Rhodovulum sp. PH10]
MGETIHHRTLAGGQSTTPSIGTKTRDAGFGSGAVPPWGMADGHERVNSGRGRASARMRSGPGRRPRPKARRAASPDGFASGRKKPRAEERRSPAAARAMRRRRSGRGPAWRPEAASRWSPRGSPPAAGGNRPPG